MEFMGSTIKHGDELVLQRGKSRATIKVTETIYIIETNETIGFVDEFGGNWFVAMEPSQWEVVGHVVSEENKPKPLPTREGWYVAEDPVDDEPFTLYLDSHGQWQSAIAGTIFIIDPDTVHTWNVAPLYESDEHFTEVSSDGLTIYNLVKQFDGPDEWHLTCECKGYQFRNKCKHVDKWQFVLETNAEKDALSV